MCIRLTQTSRVGDYIGGRRALIDVAPAYGYEPYLRMKRLGGIACTWLWGVGPPSPGGEVYGRPTRREETSVKRPTVDN